MSASHDNIFLIQAQHFHGVLVCMPEGDHGDHVDPGLRSIRGNSRSEDTELLP